MALLDLLEEAEALEPGRVPSTAQPRLPSVKVSPEGLERLRQGQMSVRIDPKLLSTQFENLGRHLAKPKLEASLAEAEALPDVAATPTQFDEVMVNQPLEVRGLESGVAGLVEALAALGETIEPGSTSLDRHSVRPMKRRPGAPTNMGELAAQARRRVALPADAPLSDQLRFGAAATVPALATLPMGGIPAAAAFLGPGYVTAETDLEAQGVPRQEARESALAGVLPLAATLPLAASLPGNLLTRILSGAGLNVGAGVAGRKAAELPLAPERKELAPDVLDPASTIMDALFGGGFGATFGPRAASKRAAPPAERPPQAELPAQLQAAKDAGAQPGDLAYEAARVAAEQQAQGQPEQALAPRNVPRGPEAEPAPSPEEAAARAQLDKDLAQMFEDLDAPRPPRTPEEDAAAAQRQAEVTQRMAEAEAKRQAKDREDRSSQKYAERILKARRQAIIRMGGITQREMPDITGEGRADRAGRVHTGAGGMTRRLFTTNGVELDRLREYLTEQGFFQDGDSGDITGDSERVRSIVRAIVNGDVEGAMSPEEAQYFGDLRRDEMMADEQAAFEAGLERDANGDIRIEREAQEWLSEDELDALARQYESADAEYYQALKEATDAKRLQAASEGSGEAEPGTAGAAPDEPLGPLGDSIREPSPGDAGAQADAVEPRGNDYLGLRLEPQQPRQPAPAAPEAAQAPAPAPEPAGTPIRPPERGLRPRKLLTRDDVEGKYATRTQLVTLHNREVGAGPVKTAADAARALQHLGRGAQERFDILLTDKAGNPLAIVGAFKGTIDGASVYPHTVFSEISRVKGAANAWMGHNHPSGITMPSQADRNLTQRLSNLFRGSNVKLREHLVLGLRDGKPAFSTMAPDGEIIGTNLPFEPTTKTKTIPVVERELVERNSLNAPFRDPSAARRAVRDISGGQDGLVFLNNQHYPVGFMPLSPEQAMPLRDTGMMDRIMRGISVSNAAAAMAVTHGKLTLEHIKNVSGLLASMDIRVLDVFEAVPGARDGYVSWAERGADFGSTTGRFSSRAGSGRAARSPDDIRKALRNEFGGGVLKRLEEEGLVEYVKGNTMPHPLDQASWDGRVMRLAFDRIPPERAAGIVLHELGEHAGMEKMLGPEKYADVQRRFDELLAAGDQAAQRARQAVPADTPSEHVQKERLAYLIEQVTNARDRRTFSKAVLDLVQEVVARMRAWAFKTMPRKFVKGMELRPRDIAALARRAVDFTIKGRAHENWLNRMVDAEIAAYKTKHGIKSRAEKSEQPFYSAVQRAVEGSKLTRAPAKDWLGFLKNQPGVKQEELDWMGLEEYLRGREGPVTKEEVEDFVKQNTVEVEEVVRGESGADTRIAEVRELVGRLEQRGYRLIFDENIQTGEYSVLSAIEKPHRDRRTESWYPPGNEEDPQDWTDGMPAEDAEVAEQIFELAKEVDASDASGTFEEYTLPGAKKGSYRELLLTLPSVKEPGLSGLVHFKSEVDVDDFLHGVSIEGMEKLEYGATEDRKGFRLAVEFDNLSSGDVGRFREIAARHNGRVEAQLDPHKKVPSFRSSHFDEPNVLAHVRFNERTDADGKRVLFIEEVQSDWHQRGRREGYITTKDDADRAAALKEFEALRLPATQALQRNDNLGFDNVHEALNAVRQSAEWQQEFELPVSDVAILERYRDAWVRQAGGRERAPDAPFKQSWPMLVMKRMLRWAAENGYDRIAWTRGEQQAERYDLRKYVDRFELVDAQKAYAEPGFRLFGYKGDTDAERFSKRIDNDGDALDELVGKQIADALRAAPEKDRRRVVSGATVAVGGEGMMAFYDKMLPAELNRYTKKWGGKVGQTKLSLHPQLPKEHKDYGYEHKLPRTPTPVHSLDITPAMRQAALEGQPLFSRRSELEDVNMAPSARFEPEWPSESRRFPKTGKPNAIDRSEAKFTVNRKPGREVNLAAYDRDGKLVGVFSQAVEGPGKGAFKVTVRPDAQRQGHATRLLEAAEKAGLDVRGNLRTNTFTPAGRDLARSYVQRPRFQLERQTEEDLAAKTKRERAEQPAPVARPEDFQLEQPESAPDAGQRPLFSRKDERDLVVTHNLSAANLRHAERMGGIAVPSLSVTRKGLSPTGFGEITLVGNAGLVDPRGGGKARVFGSDVYAPRYPEVSYKLDRAALAKLNEILQPGERKVYGDEVRSVRDLTDLTAFKEYAKRELGETGDGGKIDELAQKVLRQAGASEVVFQGFTNAGNRRYKPHTLETVVKMLKKDVRGSESSGNIFGMGQLRSKFSPEFRSIAGIKAAKDRLVSDADFEAVKKEVEGDFFALSESLAPYYKHQVEPFRFSDTVMALLEDTARMGFTRAAGEYGFVDVPQDVRQEMYEFMERLRNMPTEYFEAKLMRPVDSSEFLAAVVPDDASPETLELLRSKGLELVTYKKGDDADRQRAIAEAAERKNALFSRIPGSPENGAADVRDQNTAPDVDVRVPNTIIPGVIEHDHAGRVRLVAGRKLAEKAESLARWALGARTLGAYALVHTSPHQFRVMLRQYRAELARTTDKLVEIGKDAREFTPEERALVSDVVENEVRAGVVPPEHIQRQAQAITELMDAQSRALLDLGMITQASFDRFKGKYLPRLYAGRLEGREGRRMQTNLQAVRGAHLKGRGLFMDVPLEHRKRYEQLGWEARDADFAQAGIAEVEGKGTVRMWRDWTPAERANMGEVRDFMVRLAHGYAATQRDIAVGTLFKRLASDPELASNTQLGADWKHVPEAKIADTPGVLKYGALSGKWVHPDVYNELQYIQRDHQAFADAYRKALSLWKEGKVVLNPVSHVNNTVSNFFMAHYAGVPLWKTSLYKAAVEAMRDPKSPLRAEALEQGLLSGSFSQADLTALFPEIAAFRDPDVMQESWLSKRLAQLGKATGATQYRDLARKLYRMEDEFFKFMLYKHFRDGGMDKTEATEETFKYIFDYGDLAPGIRAVRDSYAPFVSYTAKAVPSLARTLVERPWRFAAPLALLYGLNEAAFMALYGDDDDAAERAERANLSEFLKGRTSLGTPRAVRLPMNTKAGEAMYLDVYRLMPLGDIFDVNNQAGGVPVPAPFMPSHPLLTVGAGLLMNKDTYTGEEIARLESDPDAGAKFAAYTWRQLAPNAPFVPGSYNFNRLVDGYVTTFRDGEPVDLPGGASFTGKTRGGTSIDMGSAVASTLGAKVRTQDLQANYDKWLRSQQFRARELQSEMRRVSRDQSISPKAREARIQSLKGELDTLFADIKQQPAPPGAANLEQMQ